jgi:uncharacterized membrane protein
MPAHPFSVHFPVALLLIAAAAYLVGLFRMGIVFIPAAMVAHGLGVLGLIAAILTGRAAQAYVTRTPALEPLLERHELLAYLTTWVYLLLGVWMYLRKGKTSQAEQALFTLCFAAVTALMAWSAHLGGVMVYQHGAGVQLTP